MLEVFASENILRLSDFKKKRRGRNPGKRYLMSENKPDLIFNFFTRNREKSCTLCPLAKVLQAILVGGSGWLRFVPSQSLNSAGGRTKLACRRDGASGTILNNITELWTKL